MKIFVLLTLTFLFCSCVSSDFSQNDISSDLENNSIEEVFSPEESFEISSFESSVIIQTEYPKANVYLNNIYQGKTPLEIKNVIPGFYTLSVEYLNPNFNQNVQSQKKESESELNLENSVIVKNFLIEVNSNKCQKYFIKQ